MPALDGLRILDMTQYEAGTACTQALAWMGADVVKIERPGLGDPARGFRTPDEHAVDSEYFINWNSNKRSVTLNLQEPAGRQLLLDMVPHYDVFIENYGPGVIEKLELGYDVMKSINPGIIYARIKGFGTDGPYAGYKCYDMVAQAAAGAFSITGEPDGPPMRPGPTTGDCGTGVQMALAITAAYIQKQRTGDGQLIELSMQEAMTYYLRTAIAFTNFGERPAPRTGNGQNPASNLYPCKPAGPNDYVFLMAVTPPMWTALCNAIGRADLLDDPNFKHAADRTANHQALFEEIAQWTRQRTKHEAMRELAEAGVPASAVMDTKDLFDDPHLAAREFITTLDHPQHGEIRLLRWPARMSGSEVPIVPAPMLGQHSREVVAQDLGLSTTDVDALIDQGVIGNEVQSAVN